MLMLVFLLLPKNTANQVFKFICLNDIKEDKSKCFFISNNTTWYFKGEVSNTLNKEKSFVFEHGKCIIKCHGKDWWFDEKNLFATELIIIKNKAATTFNVNVWTMFVDHPCPRFKQFDYSLHLFITSMAVLRV